MANTVSTNELCTFLGAHKNTVLQWVGQGCPVAVKARRGDRGGHQFVPRDVVNWLKDKAVTDAIGSEDPTLISVEEARRRKMLAEAGLQEIELAKQKGLVVDLGDIQRDLSNKLAEVRSNILKIPERTALRLVGETEETRIKQIIREELTQALNGIADYSFDEESDDE